MQVIEGAGSLLWRPAASGAAHNAVLQSIQAILGSQLARALAISGIRLVIGYALTVAVGMALGLITWRIPEFNRLVGPLFLGLQALPSVCWVPLAMLLPGLGPTERGVIFVTVMGSTFSIAISLRDGLQGIPEVYPRAGRMLGAQSWRLYRYVLIPASLPALAVSLRLGFSFAWRSLMGAEILFAATNHGVGFLLHAAKSDVRQVIALMIVMVLVGMIADRWIFATLQQRIQARYGLT